LRAAIKLTVGLFVLPIVFFVMCLALMVALVGLAFAVVVPLIPVLFVAFCIWAVVRATQPVARAI
jgi:hypothetical protein